MQWFKALLSKLRNDGDKPHKLPKFVIEIADAISTNLLSNRMSMDVNASGRISLLHVMQNIKQWAESRMDEDGEEFHAMLNVFIACQFEKEMTPKGGDGNFQQKLFEITRNIFDFDLTEWESADSMESDEC